MAGGSAMPEAQPVTREEILRGLARALEPLSYVDAMWEGGAAAYDRLDAWSDIDLYLVVADDHVAEAFRAVEDALTALSPIRRKYEPAWPAESGIAQAFYRLERTNEYLLVDLAVLKRSAPDKFLEPEVHGRAIFAFNKEGAVTVRPLDVDALVRRLLERLERLGARIALFGPFVSKELHRRNGLGALEAYQRIVLDSLAQALQIRYAPTHHGFNVRYARYDLPPQVVDKLESLSYVTSRDDIPEKCRVALEWFRETVAGMTEDEIRSRIRGAEPRAA